MSHCYKWLISIEQATNEALLSSCTVSVLNQNWSTHRWEEQSAVTDYSWADSAQKSLHRLGNWAFIVFVSCVGCFYVLFKYYRLFFINPTVQWWITFSLLAELWLFLLSLTVPSKGFTPTFMQIKKQFVSQYFLTSQSVTQQRFLLKTWMYKKM